MGLARQEDHTSRSRGPEFNSHPTWGHFKNLFRGLKCYVRDGWTTHAQGISFGPNLNRSRPRIPLSLKKDTDALVFDWESILVATNNFSDANKLGMGGFGPVYKGELAGGREIAVKRLSSSSRQGLQEFKNEVMLIAKLQHRNPIRLLGYCIEGEEKLLLYEYMPNKSLDYFIFGLQWLHGSGVWSVQCRGYSQSKADVYSFGVVVLEIISGKKTMGFYQSNHGTLDLLGYAWSLWNEGKALDLMDQTLHETFQINEFFKCVIVGLLCVQEQPSDRPSMSNLFKMLGSEAAIVATPKPPAFTVGRYLYSTGIFASSIIDLTITAEHGR